MSDYETYQRRLQTEAREKAGVQDFLNSSGVSIYGDQNSILGEVTGRKNAELYYGNTRDIGRNAEDYRNRIKARVDQPSALAGRLIQVSNQDLARANAKAGMSGVDTSGASIREKRSNIAKSNEIQQQESRQNLLDYGKSIGAGISGTEAMAASGSGKAIAATPTPTPSYGGGLFGASIICTELYRQRKISIRTLHACNEFGRTLTEQEFFGYLVIAKPIVKLMKKSDKFSNIFINWALRLSERNPNNFTKIMIPICGIIGNIYKECYARAKRS